MDTIKDFLMPYYFDRLRQNKRYSLKKFAGDLGISSGRLSTLFNSENIPTTRVLVRIKNSLALEEKSYRKLLQIVENLKKNRLQENVDILLDDRDIDLIIDWVPFAIISLMKTEGFQMKPEFIAKRLGVEANHVDTVITRLKKTGILTQTENTWKARASQIGTKTDIPSQSRQASHLEKLSLAREKIKTVPLTLRDYSSITFPANTRNLIEVKKLLIKFRRTIAESMQQGEPDEVYSLNIQLFPLSSGENSHEK